MAELIPYGEQEAPPLSMSELGQLAWLRKKVVFLLYLVLIGATVAYAFLATPQYRSEVLLASASPPDSSSKFSALASQLGGLASMVGNFDSGSDLKVNLAVLESREFLTRFIETHRLLPILFEEQWDPASNSFKPLFSTGKPPTLQDAYSKMQRKVLKITQDEVTQLVTVSITWTDPELCERWANDLIRMLNEYLRQRSIDEAQKSIGYLEQQVRKTSVSDMRDILFRLIEQQTQNIMLAETREQFAFRVLDKAVVPELRESPKRLLLILISVFVATVLSFTYLMLIGRSALPVKR